MLSLNGIGIKEPCNAVVLLAMNIKSREQKYAVLLEASRAVLGETAEFVTWLALEQALLSQIFSVSYSPAPPGTVSLSRQSSLPWNLKINPPPVCRGGLLCQKRLL